MFVLEFNGNRLQRFNAGSVTGTTVPNLTLSQPAVVHVDNNAGIFILDSANYRILKWVNTVVTVVAGGRGNGGSLTQIGVSYGMVIDPNFNIYVSEASNAKITLWSAGNTNSSQVVSTQQKRSDASEFHSHLGCRW